MSKLAHPTVQEAQQWATALRSGKYKQGRLKLLTTRDTGDEYCCLGVLCALYGVNEFILSCNSYPDKLHDIPEWVRKADSALREYFPAHTVTVREEFMGYGFTTNRAYIHQTGFATLNDTFKMTFDEIADIIELVFVHRVLD